MIFLVNVLWSRKNGQIAGNNPWDADSLEWAAASPPENYNFEYLPVATGRYSAVGAARRSASLSPACGTIAAKCW